MKIEITHLKIVEELSEETTCFTCDLLVNDTTVAYVNNRGNGGATTFAHYEGMRQMLNAAEKWAKEQPAVIYKTPDKDYTIPMDLELYVELIIHSITNP